MYLIVSIMFFKMVIFSIIIVRNLAIIFHSTRIILRFLL